MLLSIRTLGASANIVGSDKEFLIRRSFMCIKNSKGLELTLSELHVLMYLKPEHSELL